MEGLTPNPNIGFWFVLFISESGSAILFANGCNVAAEKNFEKDVRDKVRACDCILGLILLCILNQASIYIYDPGSG